MFTVKRIRKDAFTLVELLVVVSIIALLIAILLPSLRKARDQAKDTVCRSGLHQLSLTTAYYTEDNRQHLPWFKGDGTQAGHNKAPYRQYHQIFHFWPYMKNLKLYKCPRAKGKTTIKHYKEGEDAFGDAFSFYTVRKADELYLKAYQQRWFPKIDPFAQPGEVIDELYTEYWFNDWSTGATSGTREIPGINGAVIDRIPLPNHAVVMTDAVWEAKEPRHSGGSMFVFIDAHVEHKTRDRYYDRTALELSPSYGDYKPKDYDAFQNGPFWVWGLTRWGFDARLGH